MKAPQQQFYDKLYAISLALGYDTYHFLPERGASYPFVFIGEYFGEDEANKSNVAGDYTQFIRVYGDKDDRCTVTDIVMSLMHEIREITHTETFYIMTNSIHQKVEIETVTTGQPVVGRIEIDYKFN